MSNSNAAIIHVRRGCVSDREPPTMLLETALVFIALRLPHATPPEMVTAAKQYPQASWMGLKSCSALKNNSWNNCCQGEESKGIGHIVSHTNAAGARRLSSVFAPNGRAGMCIEQPWLKLFGRGLGMSGLTAFGISCRGRSHLCQ